MKLVFMDIAVLGTVKTGFWKDVWHWEEDWMEVSNQFYISISKVGLPILYTWGDGIGSANVFKILQD